MERIKSRNGYSKNEISEFTERRVQLATKAIGLLDELLDTLKVAKDTIVTTSALDRGAIRDLGMLTSKLVEVIKLVSREDLSDLEPTIESILEEARREFADA